MVEIYGRGGLTHYTFNLIAALRELDVEVVLLTSCEYELRDRLDGLRGARLEAWLYRRGAAWARRAAWLRRPRMRRLAKMAELLLDTGRVAALCRRERPAVAHLQGCNPIMLFPALALRSAGARLVYTAHDVPPLNSRILARLLDRFIYRLAHRVIVHGRQDQAAMSALHGAGGERVVVIPHGDYTFFRGGGAGEEARAAARGALGFGAEDRVILFFGFLAWYKGLDSLFEAFAGVRRRAPRARLLVVGDPGKLGPGELAGYRRRMEALGIAPSVVLRAEYVPMEEVPPLFEAADCVALPYREVSQSGVLHLAWAFGRPVVATRVGGFPETVRDGETGFLVPPGDVRALEEALLRLVEEDGLRLRMAAAAKAEASRAEYAWPEVARRTRELYREVAA